MLHSEWALRELPLASAEMLVFDIEPLPSNNSSKRAMALTSTSSSESPN